MGDATEAPVTLREHVDAMRFAAGTWAEGSAARRVLLAAAGRIEADPEYGLGERLEAYLPSLENHTKHAEFIPEQVARRLRDLLRSPSQSSAGPETGDAPKAKEAARDLAPAPRAGDAPDPGGEIVIYTLHHPNGLRFETTRHDCGKDAALDALRGERSALREYFDATQELFSLESKHLSDQFPTSMRVAEALGKVVALARSSSSGSSAGQGAGVASPDPGGGRGGLPTSPSPVPRAGDAPGPKQDHKHRWVCMTSGSECPEEDPDAALAALRRALKDRDGSFHLRESFENPLGDTSEEKCPYCPLYKVDARHALERAQSTAGPGRRTHIDKFSAFMEMLGKEPAPPKPCGKACDCHTHSPEVGFCLLCADQHIFDLDALLTKERAARAEERSGYTNGLKNPATPYEQAKMKLDALWGHLNELEQRWLGQTTRPGDDTFEFDGPTRPLPEIVADIIRVKNEPWAEWDTVGKPGPSILRVPSPPTDATPGGA